MESFVIKEELLLKKGNKYCLTKNGEEFFYNWFIIDKKSKRALASKLRISEDTVLRLTRELLGEVDNRRKYTLNEDIFETIDSPEKAYWLGFFAADGNVYKNKNAIQIRLKATDQDHLIKFCNFLKLDPKKIKQIKHGQDNKYDGSHLQINSKKIKDDLGRLGIGPAKSLSLSFPNKDQVPEELFKFWIMGYIDGDGYIQVFKRLDKPSIRIRITSTKEVLENILLQLSDNPDFNKIKKENKCQNTFTTTLYQKETIRFLKEVYATIPETVLQRKKQIFYDYLNSSVV